MTAVETFEAYRGELTGYAYRMLGAAFEAEDAVQETLVRAWRAGHDPARASVRTWLYAIATNVCLDMLRSAQRRARAMDLGPAAEPGPDLGAPLPSTAWVQPLPDGIADPAGPGHAPGVDPPRVRGRPPAAAAAAAGRADPARGPRVLRRRSRRAARHHGRLRQ